MLSPILNALTLEQLALAQFLKIESELKKTFPVCEAATNVQEWLGRGLWVTASPLIIWPPSKGGQIRTTSMRIWIPGFLSSGKLFRGWETLNTFVSFIIPAPPQVQLAEALHHLLGDNWDRLVYNLK